MRNGPYTLVVAPKNYSGIKYRGKYVYEHRIRVEQKLKRLLHPDEIVHHVNGDKRDNRFSNLQVAFRADHASMHHTKEKKTQVVCGFCKKTFYQPDRVVRWKKKKGYKTFYCNRSCMGKGQVYHNLLKWQ